MRFRMASVGVILLFPQLVLGGQKTPNDSIIHGTINITLGNQDGLVVLTDSMVTAGTQQLSDPGQKLFRLDDHTVCSIAGFASAPASSGRTTIPDLNTNVSALIREYVRQSALQPAQSMAEKLRALASLINLRLSAIANVRDALGSTTPISGYRFQLTIAGYDIDNKPKIGVINLGTKDKGGALISDIETASISNVEQKLSVALSGMWDIAASIQHPESGPREPIFDLYAASIRDNDGRSLTVEQMCELAKRLAYHTSKVHREVGGPNQIAIIKRAEIISIEQPFFPGPPHSSIFRFALIVASQFSYSSVNFGSGWPAVFIRCSWNGMQHELDNHIYIASEFKDSVLMYDGGDLNLGDTNKVTGSFLVLGPHAILESETVRRLTAAFSSLQVAYARPKPWQVVP